MQTDNAFTISLMDIFLFGLLVFFVFYGFRRGTLRTLYGVLRLYFSFIATVFLYEKMALLLQASVNISSTLALMICFASLLFLLLTLVWLIRIFIKGRISKVPDTENNLSKLGGAALGLLEGILVISIIIMVINFYPTSDDTESPLKDTVSYKIIKRIAPGIESLATGPIKRLKDISDGSPSNSESEESEPENP